MTIDSPTELEFHPASKGEALRQKLSSIRGLQLKGSHEGRFSLGTTKAAVSLDGAEDLRLTVKVGKAIGLREALQANAALPGNLRFAIGVNDLELIADVRLGNGDRLGQALGYVIAGLRSAVARRTVRWRPKDRPLDPSDVQAALQAVPWGDQAIVELAGGFELRPRFEGEAVPVKLTVEGSELHVRRIVVHSYEDHRWADAVAAQALRFNAFLKHARLASVGGQIVADARIHRMLLDGDSLVTAVRAVAVVERRVRHVLQILATQEDIAEHYAAMFDDG